VKPLLRHRSTFLLSAALIALALTGCERQLTSSARVDARNVSALRESLGAGAAAPGATAVAAAEPTGFATIRGSFTLTGAAPPKKTLTIDKERDVCMPGGKPVFSNELVVDPATGGIGNVVIYLFTKVPAGNEKWLHPSFADSGNATVDFDQKNCLFLSPMFAMRSTQNLKILNSDPVGHNTNITPTGKTSPFNQTIAANSFVMYQPGGESPEPFPVSCAIHPWMSARMIVRDSPYFAVSSADGSFEIPNVPAGVKLDFKVWQEVAGFLQNVTINGTAETLKKGKLTLTLQPDMPTELKIGIDTAAFTK